MSKSPLSIVLVSLALFTSTAAGGDVAVTVTGGSLKLAGTAGTDEVVIDQSGVANAKEFRVVPLNTTTVNGQNTPQTFQNVTKDIVIELGDGSDSCGVAGVKAPRDLVANTGTGGTLGLEISDSSIGDDLKVTSLGGAIVGSTGTVSVKGDVVVTGLAGIDVFNLLDPTRVGGDVSFDGGLGNDQFGIRGSFVKGKVNVDLGGDSDQCTLQTSALGGGVTITDNGAANLIQFTLNDISGNVKLTLGPGDDIVNANENLIDGNLSVDLGAGTNVFNAFLSHVLGSVKVKAGSGNDAVSTGDTCFIAGNVSTSLGDGTNTVTLEDAVVAGGVKTTGGAGDDSFSLEEGSVDKDVRLNLSPAAAATADSAVFGAAVVRGSLRASSQSDFNLVIVESKVRKNVDAKFFGSLNSISLDRAKVRQLRVTGQGGVDDVIVDNESVIIDDTDLQLGDGNNLVMLKNSVFGDDTKVRTGNGNDGLDFTGSVFGSPPDVNTGSGTDTGP